MTRRRKWLDLAAEAAQRLDGLTGADRKEAVERGIADGWPAAQNLRRMLAARAYVLSHAKNCGVDVADVRGSYEAIETLTRIAKVSPSAASEYMRAVLIGAVNAREIRDVLSGLRAKASERVKAEPDDGWPVYWEETVNELLGNEAWKISVAHKGHSMRGRWLSVDIEVTLKGGATTAIFLSPLCKFSTWARRPVEEQLPSVLCAQMYYSSVYFIFYDERERKMIEELVSQGRWGGSGPILYPPIPWNEELIED